MLPIKATKRAQVQTNELVQRGVIANGAMNVSVGGIGLKHHGRVGHAELGDGVV